MAAYSTHFIGPSPAISPSQSPFPNAADVLCCNRGGRDARHVDDTAMADLTGDHKPRSGRHVVTVEECNLLTVKQVIVKQAWWWL
jgi:hypothetical protein